MDNIKELISTFGKTYKAPLSVRFLAFFVPSVRKLVEAHTAMVGIESIADIEPVAQGQCNATYLGKRGKDFANVLAAMCFSAMEDLGAKNFISMPMISVRRGRLKDSIDLADPAALRKYDRYQITVKRVGAGALSPEDRVIDACKIMRDFYENAPVGEIKDQDVQNAILSHAWAMKAYLDDVSFSGESAAEGNLVNSFYFEGFLKYKAALVQIKQKTHRHTQIPGLTADQCLRDPLASRACDHIAEVHDIAATALHNDPKFNTEKN